MYNTKESYSWIIVRDVSNIHHNCGIVNDGREFEIVTILALVQTLDLDQAKMGNVCRY